MYDYSDFNDASWNSPARKFIWKNFIESHNGIQCVPENCYGLTSVIKKSCQDMTEDEIRVVADRLSSQWKHRRRLIINEYKDNKLSPIDEDTTALDRAFFSKPKKEVMNKADFVEGFLSYSKKEQVELLDILNLFHKY